VSTNTSLRDEKFDVLAREMFRDYLQFEQRATQETKSQMESPFPQSHPLHRPNIARAPQQLPAAKMKARRAATRERSGGGVKIPHIKEGSARVLSKPKGPNPYTGPPLPSPPPPAFCSGLTALGTLSAFAEEQKLLEAAPPSPLPPSLPRPTLRLP
jgi:hypothetical protein